MSILRGGNKCPVCKSRCRSGSFSDEPFGHVEDYDRCERCEVMRIWSYGYTTLQVGEESFGYSYRAQRRRIRKAERRFLDACRRARLQRRRAL